MSIQVFLSLGAGNSSAGFERINFRIEIDGQLLAQKHGSLPSNWELQNLHYRWQFHYAAYYENCLDSLRGNDGSIELDRTGIEGFSVTSFEETTIELAQEMCQWLDCCSFQAIGTHLQTTLAQRYRSTPAEQVIIVIESEDDWIYRLPWHCWSALADCQYAEITFSLNTYQRQTSTSHRTKPRILAVFGDRTGIDTAADAKFIQQLPADLVTLTEPSIAQLRRQLGDNFNRSNLISPVLPGSQ